jgi:hypothetical protein
MTVRAILEKDRRHVLAERWCARPLGLFLQWRCRQTRERDERYRGYSGDYGASHAVLSLSSVWCL